MPWEGERGKSGKGREMGLKQNSDSDPRRKVNLLNKVRECKTTQCKII